MKPAKTFSQSFLACVLGMFAACSAQQVTVSAPLDETSKVDAIFVLAEEVTIKARKTKPTTLRARTKWARLGTIEQGDVLDTQDQVVIVNSFDVHEASIVVKEGLLVGYFLKVEQTFVAAEPVTINFIRE